jgi:urea transport system ATP-binding protein
MISHEKRQVFRHWQDSAVQAVNHGMPWFSLILALIIVPFLYLSGEMEIVTVNMLGRYLCFAIVAVSLDLLWGYTGLLCLCQSLFFALGGYAMGMYLAHHGGPEGVIDASGWKLPACLHVVYPAAVWETEEYWQLPFFWKPFFWFESATILGLLVPGIVALVIGLFIFRSRVRGVFFAILTQALTLAVWLVFCMNNMKLCGTNGLTRFERVGPFFDPEQGANTAKLVILLTAVVGLNLLILVRAIMSRVGSISLGNSWKDPKRLGVLAGCLAVGLGAAVWIQSYIAGNFADLNELKDDGVKFALYLVTVVALIDVYLFCKYIVDSRLGRVLIAVRDRESRLRFSGYQPYVYKAFIFSISAMIAGLAGMLYAPQMGIFTPTNLEPKESILVVIWVAVGGRGTLAGPIIGALAVNLIYSQLTSSAPDTWPFVQGGLFVAVVLMFPDGLISLWYRITGKGAAADEDQPTDEDDRVDSVAMMQERLQRVANIQRLQTDKSQIQAEIVSVHDLTVVFDGFKALDIDHFAVPHYMLQVIIGPNGAGKTTLCDVISGKTRPTTGRVLFNGADITEASEADIARLGVGRKFQTPTVYDSLSVYQNMELALPNCQGLAHNLFRMTTATQRDRIHQMLERVRLDDDMNRQVKYLSHGQRQWLEISMLILSDPKLLLVDEPAAGLTDEETVLTAELLLELQEDHSIIVIEHDMEFVRMLSAPVMVLNEGLIMASGTMEEVQADERVVEAYLGR